jgi:hypothetical protein
MSISGITFGKLPGACLFTVNGRQSLPRGVVFSVLCAVFALRAPLVVHNTWAVAVTGSRAGSVLSLERIALNVLMRGDRK